MVDVFGGSARRGKGIRGPRGLRGATGLDGSIKDLCMWMPQSVLQQFQEKSESCCFFINNLSRDVKQSGNNVTEWINRSSSGSTFNLKASKGKKPATLIELEYTDEQYALEFKESGYESYIEMIFHEAQVYGFICITFRTSGDGVQSLMTNIGYGEDKSSFEISVMSTEIDIILYNANKKTRKSVQIQHDCREWTTLFLEYIPGIPTQFRYIINNDLSEKFTFPLQYTPVYEPMSLGSRRAEPFQYFQGDISSLEMYTNTTTKAGQRLPEALRELVIKNQLL